MKNQYSKLLRILITGILYIGYFSISSLLAQISEGGLPPSFQFAGSLRSEKLAEQVPVNFSVEDLKAVDAWRVSQGAPLRVAKSIPTSFDIANSGDWISLPDGSQVWQLHLQAKGAIALILYYSDFYIPKGARLYLYNAAKTQVLGAYTHRTHPKNGPFATQAVADDEVILEYVPAPSGETPRLRIREVGYGYNHLEAIMPEVQEAPGADFSGACEVNINCEEGADWQEQKKGVIQMIQYIRNKEGEGGSYICTASLVNNTARDKKPYVLSAFHCSQDILGEQTVTPEELAVWLFYFHQEHVGCDNESPIYPIKTMVGCTRKASTPVENGSDGLLLLLNDEIPDERMSAQIDLIERLTTQIFDCVKEHPEKLKQIRQFLNYYLPTTIKLMEQYVTLQNQSVKTENITEGMQKIEDLLDKVIVAFQRQLDALFESDVVDITADIRVMEQMMASEGLTEKKDFA